MSALQTKRRLTAADREAQARVSARIERAHELAAIITHASHDLQSICRHHVSAVDFRMGRVRDLTRAVLIDLPTEPLS